MPHLLIRGVDPNRLATVSEALVGELADICACPPDYILLECLHTTAIFGGGRVASYPFVEVNWFDRGAETRDRAADCIDRHIRSLGAEELEIAFRLYAPEAYYANGKRLGEPAADDAGGAALAEENAKLKEELGKVRKALHNAVNGGASASAMSSRLRDALRE